MNILIFMLCVFLTALSVTHLARFIISYTTAHSHKWSIITIVMCFMLAWGITGIVFVVKY